MNFSERIFSILIGTAITVVSPQIAVALTPEEVREVAKGITVQVNCINHKSFGSGVIFRQEDNTYFVMTNYHVVKETKKCEVKTQDGAHYSVETIEKIDPQSNLDIAFLQFKSDRKYSVANLGDSSKIKDDDTVYVAGWSDDSAISDERQLLSPSGKIYTVLNKAKPGGYTLIYTNRIVYGLSGGAILDENSRLIGIHGQFDQDSLLQPFGRGIAINTVFRKPATDSGIIAIRQIQVSGSTVFGAEQFDPIIQPLEGRFITQNQLLMAVREITQLYLNEGYLNSRAVFGGVKKDGGVYIQVIEGTLPLKNIIIEGTDDTSIKNYVLEQIKLGIEQPLNVRKLEVVLQRLKADSLFENVEASLRPSAKKPGNESELIIRVKTSKNPSNTRLPSSVERTLGISGEQTPTSGEQTPSEILSVELALQQIQEEIRTKPAFVYVNFVLPEIRKGVSFNRTQEYNNIQPSLVTIPEDDYELELVMVTAEGQPLQIPVKVTRKQILAKAKEFYKKVENQDRDYLTSSTQLYDWLLRPLEQELKTRKIDNLLFVMPPGLRLVPLAALYNREDKKYVVEKDYTISLAPSLNLNDFHYRNLKDSPVLAFGASNVPNQPSLPGIQTELSQIQKISNGQIFLNQEFTLDNFQKNRFAYPFPIVHLAMFSEFNAKEPEKSYIQFYDQKVRFSQWRDLNLNNPPIDLLVLSACDTAHGDDNTEFGLAGLALNLGVKTVIASLWSASDEGNVVFMEEFYRQLRTSQTKAEALQKTQQAMIKNPKFAHPFYWASFILIGSPW